MHHLNVHASKLAPHLWYNNDIHQAKLHRRICERKWREKKCLSSHNDYVNARNYVTKLIKVHKITYYIFTRTDSEMLTTKYV